MPWKKIVGMRNLLVHCYFEIDLGVVWAAVTNDVPELKRNVETILEELDETDRES